MVRAGKPATLLLAVRGDDAGTLLRYLAQAGLWPKVNGRTQRRGEFHAWMLAPSHFLHDPNLQRKNKSYLYGVRSASDIAPVDKWPENKILNRYLLTYREYPPRLGIRIAALLFNLAEAVRTGAATPAPPSLEGDPAVRPLVERLQYLQGETPFGRLEWRGSSLMFPMKTYVYKGKGFQEQGAAERP